MSPALSAVDLFPDPSLSSGIVISCPVRLRGGYLRTVRGGFEPAPAIRPHVEVGVSVGVNDDRFSHARGARSFPVRDL